VAELQVGGDEHTASEVAVSADLEQQPGPIRSENEVLVPVFFVVMGMLVDVGAMLNAVVFGLVISALAIVSKVFGSGLPTLFSGFNLRGSARVGVGMMPRGEVALIIAGIGLSQGLIDPIFFGVSIMMTVITTLVALIALIPLFNRGGSGVRQTRTSEELGEESLISHSRNR
jgi:Na+:H+ antiporter